MNFINKDNQMSKVHCFLKELKGMQKVIQLISNFFYNKNIPPSMKVHVHWMNLMKNQIVQKFQSFKNLKKRAVTRQKIHF